MWSAVKLRMRSLAFFCCCLAYGERRSHEGNRWSSQTPPWWKQGQRRSCRKGKGSAAAKQIPGANTRFGGFDASERSYSERGGAADSCVLAADVSICRSGPPNRAEMRRQFDQLETPSRGNFSGPLTTLLPDHCFAVTLLVCIAARGGRRTTFYFRCQTPMSVAAKHSSVLPGPPTNVPRPQPL